MGGNEEEAKAERRAQCTAGAGDANLLNLGHKLIKFVKKTLNTMTQYHEYFSNSIEYPT